MHNYLLKLYCNLHIQISLLNDHLRKNGIMGGVLLGDGRVEFAVTEKRTKEEIDTLVNLMLEA